MEKDHEAYEIVGKDPKPYGWADVLVDVLFWGAVAGVTAKAAWGLVEMFK